MKIELYKIKIKDKSLCCGCSACSQVCPKSCIKMKVDEEDIKQKFSDYHEGFKELRKRKKLFVGGVLLNIVSLLCLYIVPMFILYSMGDFTSLTVNNTITASAYVYIIGGFVPIPGASGGIEYGFGRFFGNFIGASTLSAVLLL